MLSAINNARRLKTTTLLRSALLAITIGLYLPATVCGQRIDLPAPEPDTIAAAFKQARTWLDDFKLPQPETDEARFDLADVSGVSVVLRRSGRIVGSGTDITGDDRMLRRALARAMGQTLGHPTIKSSIESNLLHVEDLGEFVALEIELAGPMQPLIGRDFHDATARLEPGVDGVAMRRDEEFAAAFPLLLRQRGAADDLAAQAAKLARDLGLPVEPLIQLERRHRITLYGFRTRGMIQPAPDAQPTETIRGEVIVADAAGIHNLANDLVEHILHRQQSIKANQEVESTIRPMLGDYDPIAETYRPQFAPRFDQALTAFALARFAQTAPGQQSETDRERRRRANAAAWDILDALATMIATEHKAADDEASLTPSTAAMIVAAWCALDANSLNESTQTLIDNAAITIQDGVRVVASEDGQLPRDATMDRPTAMRLRRHPLDRALVLFAATQLSRTGDDIDLAKSDIRSALDNLWQDVSGPQQVSLLPWIGWAERNLAQDNIADSPRRDDLHRITELAIQTQIIDGVDAAGRAYLPDVEGGFALQTPNGQRRATATGTRVASWLMGIASKPAEADGESRSFDADGCLRFLTQLSMRDAALRLAGNPRRAAGGIRQSTWEPEMPLAAQAMALLVCVERMGHDE